MRILEKDNSIIINGLADFNPEHIFTCGQCFRWNEESDKSYTGVAFGKVVNISSSENEIIIKNIIIDI